jgi:hypothetical protein
MSTIDLTPELDEDGDKKAIVAGDFSLVFQWTGERWVHRLEHRGDGRPCPQLLASSFEGDLERDDPARVVSPVYQQLQFQRNRQCLEALLVGQSGPHHFSAVFSVSAQLIQSVVGRNGREPPFDFHIDVDIADRCRKPVEFLASSYVVGAQSSELKEASPSGVTWDFKADYLNFWARWPSRASLSEAGRRATRVQAFATPQPGMATLRLVYGWIWEQNLPL